MHRAVRAAVAASALAVAVGCAHPRTPSSTAAPPPQHVEAKPTVAEIAARAARSVVVVRTARGLGTGFAVSESVIATNLHVVVGADRIVIAATNGTASAVTGVVGIDAAHDLVLLYPAAPRAIPPLSLGDDTVLRAGDGVVAIGTPQGLDLSVSTGIVGAVRQIDEHLTLLQITAPISPGSFGGPPFPAPRP